MAYKKIETLEDKLKEQEQEKVQEKPKEKEKVKKEPKPEEKEIKEPECEHECNCEHCGCEQKTEVVDNLAAEYLNMARVIQADFDNYRKRTAESIYQARQDGMISALEVILPSLDVFKKAKQMIKDPSALKGIEMVEESINNSLNSLGVEKINAVGQKFNPNYHHALTVMEDKTKQDDEILEEFQAGYMLKGKVIKYSQVIVNKLKEDK